MAYEVISDKPVHFERVDYANAVLGLYSMERRSRKNVKMHLFIYGSIEPIFFCDE